MATKVSSIHELSEGINLSKKKTFMTIYIYIYVYGEMKEELRDKKDSKRRGRRGQD